MADSNALLVWLLAKKRSARKHYEEELETALEKAEQAEKVKKSDQSSH